MFNLITRFHLLQLLVLGATTGVAVLRVPTDYAFPAHWVKNHPDWLWPRNIALAVGPIVALLLVLGFAVIGHLLTRNHLAKVRHILEPALTLLLGVLAAVQLGLLLNGVGSDLDLIRLTAVVLGLTLVVLGIVLAEAERHSYAGLRLPWPIAGDNHWRRLHRMTGLAFALAGAALIAMAWFVPDLGPLVIAFAVALAAPPALAGLATAISKPW